jgi:dolichyl-phosphate-mannose-protein mannosyltransferase
MNAPRPPQGWAWAAPYLFALALGGLLLRLALTPFGVFASDAAAYRSWAARLVATPLRQFYVAGGTSDPFGRSGRGGVDHLPGDLWFLWLIGHVYHWFSPTMQVQRFGFLFLLKLVPSLADVGIGLLLFAIANRPAGPRIGLLAAAGYLFNPAAIFVGAIWGQWDAVSAFFMVLALWLMLRGNPIWALPALTWGCLIKPQFAVLLPLVLLAWWRWRVRPADGTVPSGQPRWREAGVALAAALASVGVFLALALPFSVGVPPLPTRWTIAERATYALDRFKIVSANAFNLWGVVAHRNLKTPDSQAALVGLSYQTWGALLLGAVIIATLALFWRRPTPDMAIWAALALMLALFMFPTLMHERYLLPAVVLGVLVSALAPRLWWIGAGLTFSYLANLVVVYRLFEGGNSAAGPNSTLVLVISAINLFIFLSVIALGLTLSGGFRRAAATRISGEVGDPPADPALHRPGAPTVALDTGQ